MKKVLYNHFKIVFAASAVLLAACSEGDNPIDTIFDEVKRGAVLRTVEIQADQVLYDVATSAVLGGDFTVILEAQDVENGALLSEVEVYFGFRDNTEESGEDNDKAEILVETIPASAFSEGPFGLPRLTYTTNAEAIQAALDLPDSEIFGGDQFLIRFEMVQLDGTRYSFENNTGTLTGAFFNARFLHTANITCAPSLPTAGTWSVSTTDSFGDGWNGASLQVVIDGGAPTTITNVDDGTRPFASSTQDFTFEVPAGSETLEIAFVSGDFDAEVSFTITSANGTMVAEVDATAAGEVLDFCPNNL